MNTLNVYIVYSIFTYLYILRDNYWDSTYMLQDDISTSHDSQAKRSIGCLVGLAIGDFVGAPLEFLPATEKNQEDLVVFFYPKK
jgi:hypothetical protein